MTDWLLRLIKGMFVGTGFILPGVSGGALAAIFGLYTRIIKFIAHPFRSFKTDVLFFIPVGIGLLLGMVALSYPLDYCLEHFRAPTIWFFIGAILGTLPSLWREAGTKGRTNAHVGLMAAAAVVFFLFLRFGLANMATSMPQNFGTWLLSGALIALGILVPGLSSSNFLLYINMYQPMVDGLKRLDMGVLIPLFLGAALCMLAFSKLMDYLIDRVHAPLFHIVFGIVLASTVMIVPLDVNYLSFTLVACLLSCAAGVALGSWMSQLEDKYKKVP